jgi:HK97 gp10 family phage protein
MIGAKLTLIRGQNISQFLDQTISPAVGKSVLAGLQLIQATAQEYCPVDTGALRDSILVKVDQVALTSVAGVVGSDLYYSSFVEYGTGRRGGPAPYPHVMTWPGMKAQAYMRPAIDESRSPIDSLFRGNLRVDNLG